MTTKRLKKNDLLPVLEAQIAYRDNTLALNIPLGTPVVFTMTPVGSTTPKINRQTATVVSSTAGVVTVRYAWQPGDTDTVGDYRGEFEFTLNSDEPLTAPTNGYLTVRIQDDLT